MEPRHPSTTAFVTTQWTRVLEARGASPEARVALGELCRAYYAPVVAFLRRHGGVEDLAREQAHQFFEHLLQRDALDGVVPGKGRFRSYLLGALKHFLAREREKATRIKRGAGEIPVSWDELQDSAAEIGVADPLGLPPDRAFDRQWALTLLDRALGLLQSEWDNAGKGADFVRLKPWLTGDATHGDQGAAAKAAGASDGAFKVAVHRIRRRFREILKQEVAQTLPAGDRVEDELEELFQALNG